MELVVPFLELFTGVVDQLFVLPLEYFDVSELFGFLVGLVVDALLEDESAFAD